MNIKVKAVNGVRVPFENHAHRYIEQEPVEVENSIYYQRRIADGDLIVVSGQSKKDKGVNNG
ncbi:DUF2635 domain-containing protein [Actinobacillus pleuropneumoniae]|uniref:DUF2635 domain-containing protein n=1 Tax=Actinobacillus pleuropneumoniae TaxID=715 RepID=UPI00223CA7F0|nr:DUF2635 domain-containing protein [Actinobacillus pleuropneumoniae]